MSVHIEIKLNTKVIAAYSFHRNRENVGDIPGLNEYRVERTAPDVRPGQDDHLVSLVHHYNDPVESLVGRGIQMAERIWGSPPRVSRS
jgi:hypothetical protein